MLHQIAFTASTGLSNVSTPTTIRSAFSSQVISTIERTDFKSGYKLNPKNSLSQVVSKIVDSTLIPKQRDKIPEMDFNASFQILGLDFFYLIV